MIRVFISIAPPPLHKRQTTIKPRKLPRNAAMWCVERVVPPSQKMLEFYSWKCYILVHFISISIVTIICGYWPIALNKPLICRKRTLLAYLCGLRMRLHCTPGIHGEDGTQLENASGHGLV